MNDEIAGKVLKGCCYKGSEAKDALMAAGGDGEVILRKNYSDGGVRDICGGQLPAGCWGGLHHVPWCFSG
jgi:hypothetical protein